MAYGKPVHLTIGGMEKIKKAIMEMKGFTKEFWGLRATVVAILKGVPPNRVTHLETFMRSKEEIMKRIKTSFRYQNGGLLRPEEISYLDERYAPQKALHSTFVESLANPTPDLVLNFTERYSTVRTAVETADNEVRLTLANRSRIAFPSSKKKSDIRFSQLSLAEKLQQIDEDKLSYWYPESLPGISRVAYTGDLAPGTIGWLEVVYPTVTNPRAIEVIASWYAGLRTD